MNLPGRIFLYGRRPCRVRRESTTVIWVDYLDGKEPGMGRYAVKAFAGATMPVGGHLAFLTALATLVLDDRVPFDQARRQALKGV